LEASEVSTMSLLQVNFQLPVLWPGGSWCWLLPSPDEGDGLLHWAETLAVPDPTADGVCYGLQDVRNLLSLLSKPSTVEIGTL